MIKKLTVILCIAAIILVSFFARSYENVELQMPSGASLKCFSEDGERIAARFYQCSSRAYVHPDSQSKTVPVEFNSSAYYTPGTESFPEPVSSAVELPISTHRDKAIIIHPETKKIMQAVYTNFPAGDTFTAETVSDGKGKVSVSVYAKRDGEWVLVAAEEAFPSEFGEEHDVCAEYQITADDKKLIAVSEYSGYDPADKKEVSVRRAYLIDVGSAKLHISLVKILVCLAAVIISLTVVIIIQESKKKNK